MPTARKKALRKPATLDAWMTLGAAARAIGKSRLATLTLIVRGELVGQHLGGQTFVRRDTVDAVRKVSAA